MLSVQAEVCQSPYVPKQVQHPSSVSDQGSVQRVLIILYYFARDCISRLAEQSLVP